MKKIKLVSQFIEPKNENDGRKHNRVPEFGIAKLRARQRANKLARWRGQCEDILDGFDEPFEFDRYYSLCTDAGVKDLDLIYNIFDMYLGDGKITYCDIGDGDWRWCRSDQGM